MKVEEEKAGVGFDVEPPRWEPHKGGYQIHYLHARARVHPSEEGPKPRGKRRGWVWTVDTCSRGRTTEVARGRLRRLCDCKEIAAMVAQKASAQVQARRAARREA